jgi:hypothetical protein
MVASNGPSLRARGVVSLTAAAVYALASARRACHAGAMHLVEGRKIRWVDR